MLNKIQELISRIDFFDSISMYSDDVLQKPNSAVVFLDRIQYEPLTSSRVRAKGTISIIFRVNGSGEEVLNKAEEKIIQLEDLVKTQFAYFTLRDLQFAYQANLKSLFCYLVVEVQEG